MIMVSSYRQIRWTRRHIHGSQTGDLLSTPSSAFSPFSWNRASGPSILSGSASPSKSWGGVFTRTQFSMNSCRTSQGVTWWNAPGQVRTILYWIFFHLASTVWRHVFFYAHRSTIFSGLDIFSKVTGPSTWWRSSILLFCRSVLNFPNFITCRFGAENTLAIPALWILWLVALDFFRWVSL